MPDPETPEREPVGVDEDGNPVYGQVAEPRTPEEWAQIPIGKGRNKQAR